MSLFVYLLDYCFFIFFSLFCGLGFFYIPFFMTGCGTFHKTSTADAVPEVFCSLPTTRSEKFPFSAASTNPFCFAKTGFVNPRITAKIKSTLFGCFLFWLRYRDSNPDRQSQRLQCYHYTISQYRACVSSLYIITTF